MVMKKKSIITGALILTLASIITRIFGFVYRIYMSNTIGAEGMGLFQLIMPLYSLSWSIACSGFTTTISKLVSAENAKKQYGNMGRVLKQCLLMSSSIALMLSLFMFTFAPYIANNVLGDGRVILSLKILAIAIPFMTAGSCIRGYFLGLQETTIPAISQVFEQSIRMLLIYILSSSFITKGLEFACASAVIGIFMGEFLSFLYVLLSYKYFKNKHKLTNKPTLTSAQIFVMITSLAIPLALSRVSGSLLFTLENILIPQRLQLFGYTQKEAISLYGQITGMAFPLIFFPSALLLALSTTLVPAISEAVAVGNKNKLKSTISKSILFTIIMGIGASAIYLIFPYQLGFIIYKQDISKILFMLGILCPLMYIGITLSGILNGLSKQVFMFKNSLISSFINISAIWFFVPKYGIVAFITGWFLSSLLLVILEFIEIAKCSNIEIKIANWFLKPILCALSSGLIIKYIENNLLSVYFSPIFSLVISIICLGAIYLFLILLLGCIDIDDVKKLFNGMLKKKQQAEISKVKDKSF